MNAQPKKNYLLLRCRRRTTSAFSSRKGILSFSKLAFLDVEVRDSSFLALKTPQHASLAHATFAADR